MTVPPGASLRVSVLHNCRHVCRSRPHRAYSTATSAAARLNLPVDYRTTPLLHHNASSLFAAAGFSASKGPTKRQNLYQAINSALRTALAQSDQVLLFGEDVA
ncbi:hypothetical protein KEM52_003567, partial [Ascosphaera acerosa]